MEIIYIYRLMSSLMKQAKIKHEKRNHRKLITMAIRILVVDDQPLVRRGLRMFLSLDANLEIVGEATNGHEAIKLAGMLKPDVILMDMMMPHMNGIEATAFLRTNDNTTMIIALSSSQDQTLIDAILKAGANAFLSKEVHTGELITLIKSNFAR